MLIWLFLKKLFTNDKILDWSELKAFADDKKRKCD